MKTRPIGITIPRDTALVEYWIVLGARRTGDR
jgi:hypothetical protein